MGASLHRRQVVEELLAKRGDLLVVAGLGSTAWDITAAGDSPLSFPLWGAMGQAAMMGLGLALAQPRRRVLEAMGTVVH
ncbi:MAG TPA: aldehyde dehydrogenase, partial [Burkholderiales bacterium]|nr:aldehyde dehydrogenase [Burkholderiales bacterium]